MHGLFYAPSSSRFQGSGQPPAIIHIHGGPTSQAMASFHPQTQFFTTRGYAVLQVNHRGSTGYGKAYVDALRGQWGVYDVEDTVSGARYLVEQGLASMHQLVLMGGSAGGYTVLQTLVCHPGVFKAAICLYGIANLFTLAATTHKFEAHYLDSLIGPLPEAAALYRERSPLFAADRLRDPIALFQGEIDQVVPRAQADAHCSVPQKPWRTTRVSRLCRGRTRLAQSRNHCALLHSRGGISAPVRVVCLVLRTANCRASLARGI